MIENLDEEKINNWGIICENCSGKMKGYIYYNPVSSDVLIRLCPVCDAELIKSEGWELDPLAG